MAGPNVPPDDETAAHWLGTWSAAPQLCEPGNLPPEPLAGATLRQVVRVSVGGRTLRVRLSNAYGESPLALRAARIAASAGQDAVDAQRERALTFAGSRSVQIPAGETRRTDAVELELEPAQRIALTLELGQVPRRITAHPGSRTTSFLGRGHGAQLAAMPDALRVEHWYFIAGIDVLAGREQRAVVTLGDSITDGRGSTTDGDNRWPDELARRLRESPATAGVAVLNQGIGGNAVLAGGLGPTALERFERDVLGACGARWLIVLEGVNDIGTSAERDVGARLIDAYRGFIERAHARGLLAFGVPILPIAGSQYFSPEREAARLHVNDWIRTGGAFDATLDLDAAVRDTSDPARLAPAFDSGDHLHLSPAGYARMASAIDLELFTASARK